MTFFYVDLKISSIQVLKSLFSFQYKTTSQNIFTKVFFFLNHSFPRETLATIWISSGLILSLSLCFFLPLLPSEVLSQVRSNFCELGSPVALYCFGYHACFNQLLKFHFLHWFGIIFWRTISVIYSDLFFGPQFLDVSRPSVRLIFSGEISSGCLEGLPSTV